MICVIIQMLPNVKEYFEEPIELLDRALRACRFQKGHRMNLLRAYSRNVSILPSRSRLHFIKLADKLRNAESGYLYVS